jgi:uncharacterized protein (TIGR01244 family)
MRNLLCLGLMLYAALVVAADDPILNAHQVSPTVMLAGKLGPGAEDVLRASSIGTVIDLRTADEGTAAEQARLEASGFRYIAFPTPGTALAPERLAAFASLLMTESQRPVLLHCASGNRAGLMWALYRLDQGVPLATVLDEVAPVVTKDEVRAAIEAHAGTSAPRQ